MNLTAHLRFIRDADRYPRASPRPALLTVPLVLVQVPNDQYRAVGGLRTARALRVVLRIENPRREFARMVERP
jgi:hypothetical protein